MSGGGSSGSGAVDYPTHMKYFQTLIAAGSYAPTWGTGKWDTISDDYLSELTTAPDNINSQTVPTTLDTGFSTALADIIGDANTTGLISRFPDPTAAAFRQKILTTSAAGLLNGIKTDFSAETFDMFYTRWNFLGGGGVDAGLGQVDEIDTALAAISAPTAASVAVSWSISDWADPNPAAEAAIASDASAFGAILTDEYNSRTLPQYRLAANNIGANLSSAFAVGEALLLEGKGRDLAKYTTELRVKAFLQKDDILATSILERNKSRFQAAIVAAEIAGNLEAAELQAASALTSAKADGAIRSRLHLVDSNLKHYEIAEKLELEGYRYNMGAITLIGDMIMKYALAKWEGYNHHAHYYLENTRLLSAVRRDKYELDVDKEDKNTRWPFERLVYGANLLASISGGTTNPGGYQPSKFQSAIAGALSGAGAGAMIGGAFDAANTGGAIGAALGVGAAFL